MLYFVGLPTGWWGVAETVEGEGFQRVSINQSEKSTRLNSWRSLVPEGGNGVGEYL